MSSQKNKDFLDVVFNLPDALILHTLKSLPKEDLVESMKMLIQKHEKEGLPKNFIENVTIQLSVKEIIGNIEKKAPDEISFSKLIAEAVCQKSNDGSPERKGQIELLDSLSNSLRRTRKVRQNMFEAVLCDAVKMDPQAWIIEDITNRGANPLNCPSLIIESKNSIDTAIESKSLEILPAITSKCVGDELCGWVNGLHEINPANPRKFRVDILEHISLSLAGDENSRDVKNILKFLDVLEDRAGYLAGGIMRATILDMAIINTDETGIPIEEGVIDSVLTMSTPGKDIWRDVQQFGKSYRHPLAPEKNDLQSTNKLVFKSLLETSMQGHCHQVLKGMNEDLQGRLTLAKQGESHLALCIGNFAAENSVAKKRGEMTSYLKRKRPWNENAYRECLHAFVDAGEDIRRSDLLTKIASNREERFPLQKMAVLLEFGADPKMKNYHGRQPSEIIINNENKEAWENIVRSFEAKKAASSVLDLLESMGPKKQSGPK